ncbi:hypothetical protein BN1708_015399 [Verticillium longisporum]|uniref:MIT domain-containing protein n=1 Tax=Verticillium longisporum TaxID=100787 RepID=A0A0G4M3T2_VERLO|nr:hypothetical protein BN1708_015399 [Verticillium longisporum]
MPSDYAGQQPLARGHSRNRSQAAKGSTDSTNSVHNKDKSTKSPSQKAMLSRALQRANTAVQLDNAQNFEGARQSYAEACDLLSQVLTRTTTDEDKRKLEAIRRTYTSRIDELDQIGPAQSSEGKELPARPESLELYSGPTSRSTDDEFEDYDNVRGLENYTAVGSDKERGGSLSFDSDIDSNHYRRHIRGSSRSHGNHRGSLSKDPVSGPSRRGGGQYPLQSSFSRSDTHVLFQTPEDDFSVPPPLSPRRSDSPEEAQRPFSPDTAVRADFSMPTAQEDASTVNKRSSSRESNSWLDPIDESSGSTASSVHSRTSSRGLRRKHIRAPSGATEAEFDAALDAAVEAAYNDGYEPADHSGFEGSSDDELASNPAGRSEPTKQTVQDSQDEGHEISLSKQRQDSDTMRRDFYEDDSSEDEDRILAEITHALATKDLMNAIDVGAVPQELPQGHFTDYSWQSTYGAPPLPHVTDTSITHMAASEPLAPPPTQSLPQPPIKIASSLSRGPSPVSGQTVRSRRLSGQNLKQLKIETGKASNYGVATHTAETLQPRAIDAAEEDDTSPRGVAPDAGISSQRSSIGSEISPSQPLPPTPTQLASAENGDGDAMDSRANSPVIFPPALRKNYSSSSLRSLRSRNMSTSNLDDTSDMSPGTPLSNGFAPHIRGPAMPAIATPLTAAFRDRMNLAGGLHLFDDSFHGPRSPVSPGLASPDTPVSLEPCPTDYLLRPFWLMRCLYQTLVHPRGGYLSNKLFVPRDAWKVRGVKIRGVDDKIAICDYLTAALLKLARVDTCDADAVLEEMQALEGILEHVQANLTRKLGMEVGVQNSGTLFRDASNSAEIEAAINVPRSGSVSGKSSSFSWRRLRSKNSAAGLSSSYGKNNTGDNGKESPSLETLPMTAHPTSRPAKRDMSSVEFSGPNAPYMGSLARLFDAAQAIDQIARQVEDPGLRHADKTQVGLELCTRHAAEFFGFYICRFVMNDVSTLLDKFVKRGSEWVMA